MKRLFFLFLTIFASAFCAAQTSLINPLPGTWANRQTLVIDLAPGAEAYYSVDGDDPKSSGLAYDGPVLLDVDGLVQLNVVIANSDGTEESVSVSYTVTDSELPEDETAAEFISHIIQTGSIDYSAGDELFIPSALSFAFGTESSAFEDGAILSLDKNMVIPRDIPCTVTDGESFWRFIVKVRPVMTGLFSRKDVPFEISDWNTVTFRSKEYIYKIDDSWWQQPKETIRLDRSVSHMISWQSVDYADDNIVKFYVLPPKPQLIVKKNAAGNTSVICRGEDGYKLGLLSENGTDSASELFDSLTIDTFKGDEFSGSIDAAVYFDSVYQGKINVPFDVHKKIPAAPVIESSVPGNFSRTAVTLSIPNTKKNKLFVSVAGPVILGEEYSLSQTEALFTLHEDSFRAIKKSTFKLAAPKEGAGAYRVRAYFTDSVGNTSKVSEYSVVIDQCNYFVDGTLSEEQRAVSDGSSERPFATLSEVVPLINKSRYVHLRLRGEVSVPNEKVTLSANCRIDGEADSRLVFGKKSTFVVRNASLSVSSMVMVLAENVNTEESASLFQLERGVLYFDNVELSAVFGKNGTIITSEKGVVNIENSGLTSTAELYSCAVNGIDSKISVKNSRVSTVAQTAVNFSAQGGLFTLEENSCKVSGVMGRAAELFDTHSTIVKNTFSADLKKGQGAGQAVYTDSKNYSVEYSRNTATGF